MNLSDSDSNLREDEVVFTEQEVLRPVSVLHFKEENFNWLPQILIDSKGHYGVLPVVVCELMWIVLLIKW
jgi:hypothetical protein